MRKFIILMLLILSCSCAPLLRETGVLAGNVTIGPLQPAVKVGVPEPTPRPEIYAAREIVVLSLDGRREIARASINADGTYEVVLAVGHYLVDIAGSAIDRGIDLPQEIEIFSGQITRLDIDIDTGIR